MLINLSNHSIKNWSVHQLKEANDNYSSVIDLPFPVIPPDSDEEFILNLANEYKLKCFELLNSSPDKNNAVHIMGEMTFCFALVSLLQKENIICVASTTNRNSIEENGVKVSRFEFVRFREYPKI